MEKKTYKKWKDLTNKLLVECRKFRQLCGKPFDRGFIGELLVVKQLLETHKDELCFGNNDLIYLGSANKGWDMELWVSGKSIRFDAKATTTLSSKKEPKWIRQSASVFCDVKINRERRQTVSLKTDFDPHMFYVYVDVGVWLKSGQADYYILSDKKAKSVFSKKYKNIYDGRIRDSNSSDFWVEYSDVKKFKDNSFSSIKTHLSRGKKTK